MAEHQSTFPPSPLPPTTGPEPVPPAPRPGPAVVEWVHADYRNHAVVICQADGSLPSPEHLIRLAKSVDPEVFSIVVLAGPWLLGGFYLSPLGWLQLDTPEYHLAH